MRQGTVLILGAKSDIARATAYSFARSGFDIQLAAREAYTLSDDRADLELRYQIAVSLHDFDVLETEKHDDFINTLPELPTVAICAIGLMGDQQNSEQNIASAKLVMRTNYEGPASILSVLANRFELRGSGCIVGISSVAGERGRATNYVYGSAKAGFTAFLSGLRNRMAKKGVHVVTILPGFVATKMTRTLNLPSPLTASPDEIGNAIFHAVQSRKNLIYHRRLWFFIMLIIRNIPEFIFKKGKL